MNLRYSRRAGIWLAGALILALALAVTAGVARAALVEGTGAGGGSQLADSSQSAPTIVSDQLDYPPGATVTLAGANWQGDTSVRIEVNDDAGKTWSRDVVVAVAGDGTIVDVFDLPDWFVAVYTVKATGQQTDRVATTTFTDAVPINNSFSQAANGNPHTGIAEWIGGVLNETKTSFKEGMSTPQRLVIKDGPEDANVDANGYHYWTFGVAFQHNGKYAYDFPTGSSPTNDELWGQAIADGAFKGLPWNDLNYLEDLQATYAAAATDLLPAGYGGDGNGALKQVAFPDAVSGMPEPENTKLSNIIAAYEAKYGNRLLDVYHDGSMLEAPVFSAAALQGSLNYSSNGGTVFVNYTLKYKPDPNDKPSQLYIAWGGHIAVGYDGRASLGGGAIDDDWGLGMGAGAISGAPYHIKMAGWDPDGNIGSQDNQIMASAVIAPGLKSGHKFQDTNGDGDWDAGEPALSGWTIDFTGTDYNDDPVSGSTQTGAGGYYEFVLDPGDYTVYETPQTGYAQTRPFAGMGGLPAGYSIVDAPNGTKGYAFAMDEAEDHPDNDFGNRVNQGRIIVKKVISPAGYPASIADTDFPFTFSGPDPGIPSGFTLDLLDQDPPDDWFDTFDSGLIDVGTYVVTELVPAGWDLLSISTDDAESVVDLPNEKATLSLDPDETITVTYTDSPPGGGLPDKSGVKFEDLDADGVKDAGEPGLDGWTIFVDYDDDGTLDGTEPSGVTDADGEYSIAGITPGTYKVREVLQAGWTNSFPAAGYYEETFTYYSHFTDNDFGNWYPATKSGTKFEDLDADGMPQEPLEPGLAGWTIFVDYDDDGTLDPGEPSALTNANGDYTITGITPGTYKVREVAQAGWTNSYPASGYYEETFESRDALTGNDFGNYTTATKSGVKFEDLDADGQPREGGEPGLQGWTIFVDYDDDGQLDGTEPSDVTDANGAYTITGIVPGTFKVREVLQSGWINSYPALGHYSETFESSDAKTGNDFGNYRDATKSGTKFEDLDADGQPREAGEPGLPNWTIQAWQGAVKVAETTTDANGAYSLTLKPGSYTIMEVQKTGWNQSFPGVGPQGTYEITLSSGEIDSGNDFGNYRNATKSGMKFEDLDADGVKDAGEPGLGGWDIEAVQSGQVVDTKTTAADGTYSFSLQPGTYTFREVQQAGWTQSYPAAPGTYTEELSSGERSTANDFGNWKPATKSGVKFEDLDADGAAREAGEPLLSGWTIFVDYDDDGSLDGTEPSDVTDANGAYTITGITPGTYKVREVLQNGWTNSFPALGYYNETFESRDELTGNDFGNWKPAQKSGVKFFDLDRDGQPREAGEPGLAGWTIFVDYDDDGSLDAGEPSAVTAADGSYTISGIDPGTWKVREVLIPFWTQSYPALGYHEDTFQSSDHLRGNDFGNWAYRARTPGYWKTHTEVWSGTQAPSYDAAVGYYRPTTMLIKRVNGTVVNSGGVFDITSAFVAAGKKKAGFQYDSLLTALGYQGGSTLNGAAQILFRAATAALLNATHTTTEPKTSYPYTDAQIVSMVNAALASGDRAQIITLATELDGYNNIGEF